MDYSTKNEVAKKLTFSPGNVATKFKGSFNQSINPSELKQLFIKGSGNITSYCDINAMNISSYQDTFRGRQIYNRLD